MARVYLETSFISACVATRSDPATVYQRESSTDWMRSESRRYELFISEEVLRELDAPAFSARAAAHEFCRDIPLLVINEEVLALARLLVTEKVMPGPARGDALHVAIAASHDMDFVLS